MRKFLIMGLLIILIFVSIILIKVGFKYKDFKIESYINLQEKTQKINIELKI